MIGPGRESLRWSWSVEQIGPGVPLFGNFRVFVLLGPFCASLLQQGVEAHCISGPVLVLIFFCFNICCPTALQIKHGTVVLPAAIFVWYIVLGALTQA